MNIDSKLDSLISKNEGNTAFIGNCLDVVARDGRLYHCDELGIYVDITHMTDSRKKELYKDLKDNGWK